MKKLPFFFLGVITFFALTNICGEAFAQVGQTKPTILQISNSPSPTIKVIPTLSVQNKVDITLPDNNNQQKAIKTLFAKRPTPSLTIFNFNEYIVQYAVGIGVPANTIVLILLLPLLATIVAFVRHVIGLPSLGMLVAISFSITFLTIGIV